ncbi:hypothetical protein [Rhizobium phage RHEph12]|nr:hypothetical protein [Rhizobium phage RHEph12]
MADLSLTATTILLLSTAPRTFLRDTELLSEEGETLGEVSPEVAKLMRQHKEVVSWQDTAGSSIYVTSKQNKKLIKRLRKVEETLPEGWEAFDSKKFTWLTAAGKNPSKFLAALIPDRYASVFKINKAGEFVHTADDSGMRIRLAVRNGGAAVLIALVITEDSKAVCVLPISEAFGAVAHEVAASEARLKAKKAAKANGKKAAKSDLPKAA